MSLRSLLVATAVAGAVSAVALAQTVPEVKLPPSPGGQAAVQLGGRWEKTAQGERYRDGKWLVVAYGRPLLRGRTGIFGSGADYGKRVSPDAPIWRMGANDTTTLTTQAALQIGNGTLQPGVYNLFADLKANGWTLVVNTQPRQPKYDPNDKVLLYGSYNYDSKADVLRAPMTVRTVAESVEQLTIGFVNVTDTSATLTVAWDKTVASIELRLAPSGTK
jgi:opacity protein-like surface antigen